MTDKHIKAVFLREGGIIMNKEELISKILNLESCSSTKKGLEKHTEEFLTLYLEQLWTNERMRFLESENRKMEKQLENNRNELNSLYRKTGAMIEQFKLL
jgi:hypothetical protein